jgi:glycosyltransferase involved in cell wall biosynthesis
MSSIALVMIARDEARCIARCLDSARDWVDEMWVLDTGSVDDTPAIAKQCGARVAHWRWSDDFAAARNAALASTQADWRLVLDADEWISAGAESLAALRTQPAQHVGLVQVASLIAAEQGGELEAPSWLPRLLPRGVKYLGRVHEQPICAMPRRRLPLVVAHDGYLPAQLARKAGRNRHLLQLALEQQPHDAYLLYQLGKDHEVNSAFADAEAFYARAFEGTSSQAGWRHDLVLRRLFSLKKLRRFDAGMALAESEAPHWGHSPDFFFTLGDLLLDWAAAQPERATALLPMIEANWRRALQIGENPQLQDTVRGRGSFLAAHNLAVLSSGLGDEAQARVWREQAARMRADSAGTPKAQAQPA